MSRTLNLALVSAMLMVTWDEALGERFLAFSGYNGEGVSVTVYVGTQTLGSQTITTIFCPATMPQGEPANSLRDQFMSELGIPNVGKQATLPLQFGHGALQSVQVFHGDNIQFWVSTDEANWILLPPWEVVSPEPLSGLQFRDCGSNGTTAAAGAGGVPAVGGVGLVVMVAVMLVAGGYILKNRQASLAA